ncbi:DUF6090 family protein [Winogradskyella aurantia]|nr:DUF6090 family protein [Winogradskyella aurantia]
MKNQTSKPASQTGRYFKYAIGEIILVVIGILIALQINNWNETRKERAFELEMLRSFKTSLTTDLADINYNIAKHQASLLACDSILELMTSSNQIHEDALSELFAKAFFVTRFVYSSSAFESLKAKGVNIISNQKLRKKIIDVYDSRYRFFGIAEDDYAKNYFLGIQEIFPLRFEGGVDYDIISGDFVGSLRPIDFELLKKDEEFMYYLKTNRNWTDLYINFHYKGLKSDVVALIDLIDQELNKRQAI